MENRSRDETRPLKPEAGRFGKTKQLQSERSGYQFWLSEVCEFCQSRGNLELMRVIDKVSERNRKPRVSCLLL